MRTYAKWLYTGLILGSCTAAAAAAAPASPPAPNLVVFVVVDQFGADLLDRWLPQLSGGLQRLAQEGVAYRSAYHAHGITETCAGHATLASGRHPRGTGVIANLWIDRETGKPLPCVSAPENHLAHDAHAAGVGPDQLLATTLGDWLKSASPKSRVVSVAGKDRAAIMLGGQHADGAFWYADGFGFTTYVRPGQQPKARLAAIASFNASAREKLAHVKPWTYSAPECARLEASYTLGNRTWKSGLPPAQDAALGNALPPPMLDSLTLDAAEHLITTLHLGRNPGVTDLLLVGLSGTDRVGHYFGTQGPEMCDHLRRLDQRLGRFLSFIEATRLPVLVALSADHGAADFPERLHEEGYDASRFHGDAWLAEVNRHLAAAGTGGIHLASAIPEVLSQLMLVDDAGQPLTAAARAAAMPAALAAVRSAPRVREAHSVDELASIAPQALHTSPTLLSVAQRLALSANVQHASDILVAFEPLQYSINAAPGVLLETHGSPYDYDRRVPMLFWWPGVEHSERLLPVATVDLAPTLAAAIGVPTPPEVKGHCLEIHAFARATCPGN